jgi:hypothetical protein
LYINNRLYIKILCIPQVVPGYLRELVPTHAPDKAEPWTDIMKDIERVIMPGVTHWHHPQVSHMETILRYLTWKPVSGISHGNQSQVSHMETILRYYVSHMETSLRYHTCMETILRYYVSHMETSLRYHTWKPFSGITHGNQSQVSHRLTVVSVIAHWHHPQLSHTGTCLGYHTLASTTVITHSHILRYHPLAPTSRIAHWHHPQTITHWYRPQVLPYLGGTHWHHSQVSHTGTIFKYHTLSCKHKRQALLQHHIPDTDTMPA